MKWRLRYMEPIEVSSHPVRGAWIEIMRLSSLDGFDGVAPREGCVD